jgi:hypothetical protein
MKKYPLVPHISYEFAIVTVLYVAVRTRSLDPEIDEEGNVAITWVAVGVPTIVAVTFPKVTLEVKLRPVPTIVSWVRFPVADPEVAEKLVMTAFAIHCAYKTTFAEPMVNVTDPVAAYAVPVPAAAVFQPLKV